MRNFLLTSRDWVLVGVGLSLTVTGIITTVFGSIEIGMIVLFLLGLLLLILGILQRKHQYRLQERVLYLIGAEKKRLREPVELDSVSMKRIIGLLHAQQISLENLNSFIRSNLSADTEE